MPPVTIVVCALGAVLGALAVADLPLDLRVVAAVGLAAFAAYCAFFARSRLGALALLFVIGGAANAAWQAHATPQVREQRTARYDATILERTNEADGSTSFIALLASGIRVVAAAHGAVPPPGAHAVLRGRLEPFDGARNPGEPSEAALERERGNDARLEGVSILSTTAGSVWDMQTWLPRAHAWAHAQFGAELGEPAASVLAGELWGERAALPPDLRAEFTETGTVHVLVTAGLHLGAVAALLLLLLAPLALPRWLTCTLAIGCVWLFVWWSGAQLPAVRAASMATAALAARTCGRATFSWNALAIAAIAVAFTRPQSVASASFALSFSCVGAIFACAAPLEAWLDERVALPDRVREAFVLSLATQLGTWPVSAAVFLQFAPYALPANLAVVPCVAATMLLGAVQLALAWCAPLAQGIANLNSWLLAWVLGVVRTLASLPGASLPMTPAPSWCIAAYDAALLAAPWLWRRGGKTLAVTALLAAAGCVLWPPRAHDSALRITVLDVGQADSIVIQTPGGHAILVDAGGRLERGPQSSDSSAEQIGERIVVPFLLRQGIHSLDAVIISHPHGDHVGGCSPVLRKLRVVEIADSGQVYGGHAYHDCLEVARSQHVPVLHPRAGTTWRTDDGVTLRFIAPQLPFIGGRNAINDNSLAFILQYRGFRMLFTGDAGSAAEQRFLQEGLDLRTDVLKVGHHGSAYGSSPEFVAAVHPRFAIVSVGRHNLFGHPAPSTIETLRRYGASVYRTDEDGAVTVTFSNGVTTVSRQILPGDHH
jgi:competence protein ComEC